MSPYLDPTVERFADLQTQVTQARADLAAVIDQAGWAVARAKDLGRQTDRLVLDLSVLAQEHKMLREAYIANEQAGLTFWGRLRWLLRGR